jgi:hypothetical protein
MSSVCTTAVAGTVSTTDTADPRARAWTSKPDGDLQAYRAVGLLAGVTEQLRQRIQNRRRDATLGARY